MNVLFQELKQAIQQSLYPFFLQAILFDYLCLPEGSCIAVFQRYSPQLSFLSLNPLEIGFDFVVYSGQLYEVKLRRQKLRSGSKFSQVFSTPGKLLNETYIYTLYDHIERVERFNPVNNNFCSSTRWELYNPNKRYSCYLRKEKKNKK